MKKLRYKNDVLPKIICLKKLLKWKKQKLSRKKKNTFYQEDWEAWEASGSGAGALVSHGVIIGNRVLKPSQAPKTGHLFKLVSWLFLHL